MCRCVCAFHLELVRQCNRSLHIYIQRTYTHAQYMHTHALSESIYLVPSLSLSLPHDGSPFSLSRSIVRLRLLNSLINHALQVSCDRKCAHVQHACRRLGTERTTAPVGYYCTWKALHPLSWLNITTMQFYSGLFSTGVQEGMQWGKHSSICIFVLLEREKKYG